MRRETVLWSPMKKRFVKGPKIVNVGQFDARNAAFCSTNLNDSFYAVIAFAFEDPEHPLFDAKRQKEFAVVHFETQKLSKYPSLSFSGDFLACSSSVFIQKDLTPQLVTHLQTRSSIFAIYDPRKSQILTYDLSLGANGQWRFHQEFESDPFQTISESWSQKGKYQIFNL